MLIKWSYLLKKTCLSMLISKRIEGRIFQYPLKDDSCKIPWNLYKTSDWKVRKETCVKISYPSIQNGLGLLYPFKIDSRSNMDSRITTARFGRVGEGLFNCRVWAKHLIWRVQNTESTRFLLIKIISLWESKEFPL